MNAKQLYNEKRLALAAVSGLIDRIRGELANLSTIDEGLPNPDHGDL